MIDGTSGELEMIGLLILEGDKGSGAILELVGGGATVGTVGIVGRITGGTTGNVAGGTIGGVVATGGDGGILEGRINGMEVGIRVGDDGIVGNPLILSGIVTKLSSVLGIDVRITLTGLVTGLTGTILGIFSGGGPDNMAGDGGLHAAEVVSPRTLIRGDDRLIVFLGLGELGNRGGIGTIGTTLAIALVLSLISLLL